MSVAGLSYAALSTGPVTSTAVKVSNQASCRTVDGAIVAYVAQHGAAPKRTADLKPYVNGDISAYRIVRGQAAGPGCA
ncbi:hypothetical protein [Actinoplanes sp. NPDC049681]|uniref:hypothetical protein n=1 Tax=Actinoplanes sp. NPDC049681 TaxID=3363905 RepID=UPI00379F5901